MTIKEFKIQYALGSLTDDMKIDLACNPNTPKKILTKLSTDKYWSVRYFVKSSNARLRRLRRLSK